MKADESTNCAGSCESRFSTWLHYFFSGASTSQKEFKKKTDFGWVQT
jgi:hypothetical protein